MDALCATQGDRLVVILGGIDDPDRAAHAVVRFYGEGAVVVGPRADDLASAHVSARSALSGLRAAGDTWSTRCSCRCARPRTP